MRRSLFEIMATQCRKGSERLVRAPQRETARGKEHMTYQILFAALCAVIAGNILVAVIAIIRAYREEKSIRRFSRFAPR